MPETVTEAFEITDDQYLELRRRIQRDEAQEAFDNMAHHAKCLNRHVVTLMRDFPQWSQASGLLFDDDARWPEPIKDLLRGARDAIELLLCAFELQE